MGGRDTTAEDQAADVARKEKTLAAEEQLRLDKIQADEKAARDELKLRGQAMQGGGRSGLIYGANKQGVT